MVNHPNRSRRRTAAPTAVTDLTAAAPKPRLRRTFKEPKPSIDEVCWHDFRAAVQRTMKIAAGQPMFCTDATGLYDVYLAALPAQDRMVHTCNSCRRFIETYGGLVAVNEGGTAVPVMWHPNQAPKPYEAAVANLNKRVSVADITGVFLSGEPVWGTPRDAKGWTHLAVTDPPRFRSTLLTADQQAAKINERFGVVLRALAEFSLATLDEAIRIVEVGHLAESHKFLEPLRWLRQLHDRPRGRLGVNLLWQAIAIAPEGFCHPRTGMTGSLLEDIAAGKSAAVIKRAFDAKMHPLRYQRPQAAPAAGNIVRGERIIEQMGLTLALERRFARLDECAVIWYPKPSASPQPAGTGVFSHIAPKREAAVPPVQVDLPPVTMTWEKFYRAVVPKAQQMEVKVAPIDKLIALTSAVHADAPPILKWDRPERRNQVAWYVHSGGASAIQYQLRPGWVPVTALVPLPTLWAEKYGEPSMPHIGNGVVAVLQGAADTSTGQGNALFPECLREELHEVRATIEAYSRSAVLSGVDQASACGYDIRSTNARATIRVWDETGRSTIYQIDRWD